MQSRKNSEIEIPLLQTHQQVYSQNSSDPKETHLKKDNSKENKICPQIIHQNPTLFFNAGPRDQKMVFDDKSLFVTESQIISLEPYELEWDLTWSQWLEFLSCPVWGGCFGASVAIALAMATVTCPPPVDACCCVVTSNYASAALLATEIGAGIGGGSSCIGMSTYGLFNYTKCLEVKDQRTDIRNFYRVGRDVLHIINSYIPEDISPSPIITPT